MPEETHAVHIFRSIDLSTIIEALAIALAAVALILIIQRTLTWIANRLQGKRRLTLLVTMPFIRLLIILAAVVMIAPLFIEPSLQNMVAFLGSIGLAIGFALKDYTSSLVAGIVAIGEQNYRNGDWIKVNDIYGEVRHVGMRTVEVVTPDDDRVLIPHTLLWNQSVSNANNGNARLQCVTDFYLHPLHDSFKARQALEDVALTSPYLYFDDPVAVVVNEKPWGTHYRIRAYPVDAAQQFRFITDLTSRGKVALSQLGFKFTLVPAIPSQAMKPSIQGENGIAL